MTIHALPAEQLVRGGWASALRAILLLVLRWSSLQAEPSPWLRQVDRRSAFPARTMMVAIEDVARSDPSSTLESTAQPEAESGGARAAKAARTSRHEEEGAFFTNGDG